MAHSLWAAAERTTVHEQRHRREAHRHMFRLRLIAAMALALVLVVPATALAAGYDVSGTVTDAGGAPVAGIEVTIIVEGDQILADTSDENGAWTIPVDVEPGTILTADAIGPLVSGEPDADGCVTSTAQTGTLEITMPAEGAVDPVVIVLDIPRSGKVCSATATPERTDSAEKPASPAKPGTTPPATDTIARGAGVAGNGSLLLVAGLVGFMGATIAITTTRRPRRR
jgi:hypothetical protein